MYLQRKGTVPNQAHVSIPEGTCEEEHGRQGFAGSSSHLYRRHPPTAWTRVEGPLRPRAFDCLELHTPDEHSFQTRPLEILRSHDLVANLSHRAESMPYFFRNADGDELHFIHAGYGRFETDYGWIAYEAGDYVVIPKGTTYRILVESGPILSLVIETPQPFTLPDRGLLGHHALFDRGVLVVPELDDERTDAKGKEWEVRIKHRGDYTSLFYDFYPMDVIGWKGDVWVAKLNVRDFRPVVSPRYHLPPSAHATFQAGGALVSTFAPRPLETDPAALRVPFYHRNVDYDEVLFYHRGNFFSRAGIRPGMLTVHPQGIHHGPQPAAVDAAKDKVETEEVAIMIESRGSLTVSPDLESVEWKDYAMSWSSREAL